MDTVSFYARLPILKRFLELTNSKNFKSVPRDWYILISDIIGSTKAIETGRYKDVNLLGACSIIAVLNIAGEIEVPFVFGGDGAAILIPPCLYAKARDALLATRQRARVEFGMKLRVGAVPVIDVIAAGYDIKIAKFWVSDNYYQAAFTGDGLSYATDLIKDSGTAETYQYKNPMRELKADFSGLECRWQDIPSEQGETVSLIVKATSTNTENNNKIYRGLIEQILSIYKNEESLNPIAKKYLKLAFNYKYLRPETLMRARSSKFLHRLPYFSKIVLENFLGSLLMNFKVTLGGMNWGVYKETALAATDYKKFDDMLRMVITVNKLERTKLTNYLEKKYQQGKLVYGLHISDRALMTCLVFERNGRQVHFVDGADGGYALAAKEMKQKLNEQKLLI